MIRRLLTLFAALLASGCSGPKESPRAVAEKWFELCAGGKYTEAYEQSAQVFKFTRTAQYFEARALDMNLDGLQAVAWSEPVQHGNEARLRGEFKLKDGSKLALNVTLLSDGGRWRLAAAKSDPAPGSGVVEDVFAVTARTKDSAASRATEVLEPIAMMLGPELQLQQLAEETLLKLSDAIQRDGDFTEFYADAADRWKFRGRDPRELASGASSASRSGVSDPFNNDNRLTVAALRNAFDAAVREKVDLSAIKGKKMLLSEPARINSDGVLSMKGTFDCSVTQGTAPGMPRKLEFTLEYVFEGSRWKVFGVTMHLRAPLRGAQR